MGRGAQEKDAFSSVFGNERGAGKREKKAALFREKREHIPSVLAAIGDQSDIDIAEVRTSLERELGQLEVEVSSCSVDELVDILREYSLVDQAWLIARR